MEKKITGVKELLEGITEEPSEPKGIRELKGDNLYGLEPHTWGEPTSLFGQDAASRLGIDMGAPSIKTAMLRQALLHPTPEDMEKIALLSPLIQGGKFFAKGVGKVIKGVGKAIKGVGKAGGKGSSNFGKKSRNFFSNRRQASAVKSQTAKAERAATHAAKTEGMSPGRRMMSNVGHQASEVARGTPGKALAAGGTAWSLSDGVNATKKLRNPGVGGYGA